MKTHYSQFEGYWLGAIQSPTRVVCGVETYSYSNSIRNITCKKCLNIINKKLNEEIRNK